MRVWVVLAAILIPLSTVLAKGEPDPKALAQLAASDRKKAAKGFAKLLDGARKALDLKRQQETAEHIFALVPMEGAKPRFGAALPLPRQLNKPNAYAYFSAHHLAYDALTSATATGNYTDLNAALALAVQRGSAKYGRFAQAMATYAKGLRARAKPDDARKAFATVLSTCGKHGWGRLALHAGVELTLINLAAKDTAGATRVLQETLSAVREDTHPAILYDARTMVSARLQKEHPASFKAWDDVLAKRLKGYIASKAAGKGGDGRTPGTTPLGAALRKWKKSKPLVRVTRQGDAYVIACAFGKLEAQTHRRSPGITHVEQGGLTLAFWQSGVRLQHVSPNNEAIPGANAAPGLWQHFDPLADGETWALYATGEIRIK